MTVVLLREGQAQSLHAAKERGFVNAQGLGGGQTVVVVLLDGGLNRPGVDDFLYITGDEGDYADTAGRQGRLERLSNRATDKALGTRRGQLPDFFKPLVAGQQDRGWSDPWHRLGFDDAHKAGHVKNRCDAIVPDGKSRFHDPRSL